MQLFFITIIIIHPHHQVQSLTHQLERKENEVGKAQEKLRKVNADLDTMKRSKQTTTTQLRDAHEKEVGRLTPHHTTPRHITPHHTTPPLVLTLASLSHQFNPNPNLLLTLASNQP